MRKRKATIFCIIPAAVAAFSFAFAGCDGGDNIARVEIAGESTVIENVDCAPTELGASDVAYAYLGKQKELESYKSVTSGTTKAQKGFIRYEQRTYNSFYKSGDEYFESASSSSAFVKMTHECFVKGDRVAYSHDGGEIKSVKMTEYKDVYGVCPSDVALGGYIINAQSILSAEKTGESDGLVTYRYTLDGAVAAANAVKQMKEFGGLNGYPSISSLALTLTIKSDWTPVELIVESSYSISIKILGSLNCTHKFVTTFSDVGAAVEIPDRQRFAGEIG